MSVRFTAAEAEHGPADEEDVVHPLQLDHAVDRQVRASAARQLAVERNVYRHRSVLHRRVDAGDVARMTPLRVSMAAVWPIWTSLACFRDAQLGLQHCGVTDPREVRAGGDALSFFERHLLQDAGIPPRTCRSATCCRRRGGPDRLQFLA